MLNLSLNGIFLLFLVFLFGGCVSSPKKPMEDSCFCGALDSVIGKQKCGLWVKTAKGQASPIKPLALLPGTTCTQKTCMKFAKKARVCRSISFWKSTRYSKDLDSPCYCDFIELGPNKQYCAIWKKGDIFVREYQDSQVCNKTVCGSELFRYSSSYCTQ